MSAAGSGWLGHIPRAGNQGRSRHATSCTGCAKPFLRASDHSARQDRHENPWQGLNRDGPNRVDSLGDLLATLRRRWRCDYGGQMTVYAIAQLKFTDRNAYDRYQAAFMEVFVRHSGTVLAADEAPQIIEGQSDREKVVLMEFPDETAFRE